MTKTTIIFIFGGLALIGATLLLVNNTSEKGVETEGVTFQTEQEGKKMAFSEFLRQDTGSYDCTVSQYIDEGMSQTVSGRVFLDAGRIRGDFSASVSGISLSASTLVLDGFVYSWTSMSPMGFKVPVDDKKADKEAEMSGAYAWNAEKIGEYDCQEWQVDETKFTLPENVTFQEI